MPDFLLELFSEEIPARMQARAAEDLKRLFAEHFSAVGLAAGAMEAHVTPRRLVLHVEGLPERTPDTTEERKGPRVDAPQQAIDGFLKSTGLTLADCEQRETPKGPVWFAVLRKEGQPTANLLVAGIDKVLRGFPWPKSMRWQESAFRWVRPLHHILALFDGKPLAGAFEADHRNRYAFNAMTHGHRFLGRGYFPVRDWDDYRQGLEAAHVVLDREVRKRLIAEGAAAEAKRHGLVLRDDPGLVEEVAGLVEYPVVLSGRIDDAFMDVPKEVLVTSMRSHQRYFALETVDGDLANRFVVVANTTTRDGGKEVVAGNERVLRARLSDAKFFWDQDRQASLSSKAPRLRQITFHEKLGTMDEKVDRIQALAVWLARRVPGADLDRVRSAARLAKADLVTGMVGEFPELQGIMGRYYALNDGEHAEVAEAVAEHYSPLGPNDVCPTRPVSVAVALADKLDTLVGFWSIGEKPTGSRDPYALRRAALGVIRLILENGLRLSLTEAIEQAQLQIGSPEPGARRDLLDFFADRLKVILREQGVRHDLIDAVFAAGGEDDLVRLLAKVESLAAFLGTDDGANLLTAYGRAANIVRIEAKRDGVEGFAPEVDQQALAADEEQALEAALGKALTAMGPHLAAEDFAAAMGELARLRQPVDAFFDRVTVNADDATLRRNRLALLAKITVTMNQIADFSRVEA
ncbi:MAG: glycine--tRNA ligase subunit beta [Azospirillaceae bacterium]